MNAVLKSVVIALCFCVAGMNLFWDPFAGFVGTAKAIESGCDGAPPGDDCECCTTCGCWQCESDIP